MEKKMPGATMDSSFMIHATNYRCCSARAKITWSKPHAIFSRANFVPKIAIREKHYKLLSTRWRLLVLWTSDKIHIFPSSNTTRAIHSSVKRSTLQSLINIFTRLAAIKLRPHRNVSIPRFWMNPDVPCYNWFVQYVPYYCIAVRVGSKHLKNNIIIITFVSFKNVRWH